MYNTNLEKITRISMQINEYVNMIGKARISVYQLPGMQNRESFSLYLNSFMTLLRRNDLRPVYSWSYNANSNSYILLLMVNGMFRDNMDDILNAANRLWRSYSTGYILKITDMAVSLGTLDQDKETLWNILQQTAFSSTSQASINPYHQHHFACCRVY